MNFNKANTKKSLLKYLPFIVFFAIIFIWHLTVHRSFDDVMFGKVYHDYNIFNYLAMRYETWSSRLLIEFFLVQLAGLPKMIWNFFDSIVFLLMAVLIPKLMLNMDKIDEKKSVVYNSLSCVIVLIYIFTSSEPLSSAGPIATTLNYTWPLFFALLHFYLVKKYIFTENRLSAKGKVAVYVLMIFALMFAINQELMLIVVSEVYFFIILYCLYSKVKIPKSIFFIVFIIFLDFLGVYLCPGNHLRYIHEVSHWFPNYYSLNLVDKIDLGVTVLFDRVVLLYSLINLFFFAMLGIYIFSITKKKISILVSLMPLIIVVGLGVMHLLGFINIISFIDHSVTKYGLLHSNLRHVLIFSAVYVIIVFSIGYSLIEMYKHGVKKLSFMIFGLLILGFTSQMMRGFSPTVWASAQRWELYYYFAVTCATYLLSVNLLESRYDSCKNWLMNRKIWKFMSNLLSGKVNHDRKRRLT